MVPVSVTLGEDYDVIVITGPNTGGKTVTLKTIGLMCLLAMSGIFVPCEEESVLSFFEDIFCDIGDEQSIEQNLSTFSGHMTNLRDILAVCGKIIWCLSTRWGQAPSLTRARRWLSP